MNGGETLGRTDRGHDPAAARIAELEAELRLARLRLDEAARARARFVTGLGHEVRTPMSSVLSFVRLLRRNQERNLTPRQQEHLLRIEAGSVRVMRLVNDVLDLARLDEDRVPVVFRDVDVADLVRRATRRRSGGTPPRTPPVVLELRDDARPLRTDPARLEQIVSNVVRTALRSREREPITVRLETDDGGSPQAISIVCPEARFGEDGQETVFEAFEGIGSGTDARGDDSPLGLAVSRALGRLLGFGLDVRARPGGGAVFSLSFTPAEIHGPSGDGGLADPERAG